MSTTPEKQPAVPPEALSWCIDKLTLRTWNYRGAILTKAHHVKEVTDAYGRPFHRPICGAQVAHPSSECAPAPESWPACRHCAKKLVPEGTIPAVYIEGGPDAD